MCAGPIWECDVGAAAEKLGVAVLSVDPLRGNHDITRPVVRDALLRLCARPVVAGEAGIIATHVAPPCRSFSPSNKWRGLRNRADPEGSGAQESYKVYIDLENAVIAEAIEIADVRLAVNNLVTIEKPPSRNVGTPWYWRGMEDTASLWMTRDVQAMMVKNSLRKATAPMCAFG